MYSTTARRFCFLIVAWLAWQPVAMAGELDKIRASGTIVVAHRETSIPFSYIGPDGRPIGYAMDLCAKVVDGIKKHLQLRNLNVMYLPVSSASRIPAIAEHRASLECGSTTNNAERRTQVDYTISHYIASSRFVVKRTSGIKNTADLRGKTVVSTKGTSNLETLKRVNDEQSLNLKIVEATDHAEAFAQVASGAADAFAMDDVLLSGLRANSAAPQDYVIIGKPMTIEPYAIMLPKGDAAFKRVVDAQMRRIVASGDINKLYKKWFESPIAPKGINMELPMSFMLRESFKFPSDKVGELN